MKSYLLLATITWRTLIMNEYRILKKVLSAKNKCLMSMVQMILHILPYRKHIWPRRTVFQAAKVVIISFLILYHVMFMLQSRGLDSLCMTIALTYCLISSWIKTRQAIGENHIVSDSKLCLNYFFSVARGITTQYLIRPKISTLCNRLKINFNTPEECETQRQEIVCVIYIIFCVMHLRYFI